MRDTLIVFTLPEDLQPQQPLVDRAEEDLMCAICLYREGACGYPPLLNICYLLLQGIEKWLKVFIAVQDVTGVPTKGRDSHNLSRFFTAVAEHEPAFEEIRQKIEATDAQLLSHDFNVNLRYNDTPTEIETYIEKLIPAAFDTRRVVKRFLKRRQYAPNQI
jgi:hypothetical protein